MVDSDKAIRPQQMGITQDLRLALLEPAGANEETAEIYRAEARSAYESEPQRAALMLLDAAYANERDDAPIHVIVRDLMAALQLAPESRWVLSSVRRLLMKLGAYKQALSIIEMEYKLVEDESLVCALYLEAAYINWILLEDSQEAKRWVMKLLETQMLHMPALYTAVGISCESREDLEAASYAESLAPLINSPQDRSSIFSFAAHIFWRKSDKIKAALLFEQAVRADRANVYANLSLAVLKEESRHFSLASQYFESVASLCDCAEIKAAFYLRAAILRQVTDEEFEKAAKLLELAESFSTDPVPVLLQQLSVYETLEQYPKAVQSLKKLIDLTKDSALQAAYTLELADILQYQLAQNTAALEALYSAWNLDNSLTAAFDRLRSILLSSHRWDELHEVYEQLLKLHSDDSEADTLRILCAESAIRANKTGHAIEILAQCSDIYLQYYFLSPLLESQAEWAALARLTESFIDICLDSRSKHAAMMQLVEIHDKHLQVPQAALTVLQAYNAEESTRSLSLKRIKLLRKLKLSDRLALALLEEAETTTDSRERRAWLFESALCYDRDLNDGERAKQILNKIISEDPHFLPAIEVLREISLRSQDWDSLKQANAFRIFAVPDTKDFRSMEVSSAWASEMLDEHDLACEKYKDLLKQSALPSWSSLRYAKLLQKTKQWQALFDHFVEQSQIHEYRASHFLIQASIIYSYRLINSPAHSQINEDFFALSPNFLSLSFLLIDYITTGQHERIEHFIVEGLHRIRATDEVKALLQWVHAEILCLNSVDSQALLLYQQCFNQRYGSYLRMEITRLIRAANDDHYAPWLEKYASFCSDKPLHIELLREASLRYSWDDEDSATHVASLAYKSNPDDLRTLWVLERYAASADDWNALAQLREKMAQLEVLPQARLHTLTSAILPYIDAALSQHALRVANEVLKFNAHSIPALITMAHLAESASDWLGLAKISDRLAEACQSSSNRFYYGSLAAKIWFEKLQLPEQAMESVSLILAHDCDCFPAIAMAEQLLHQTKDFHRLNRIYARAIAVLDSSEEQITLLRKNAALIEEQFADIPGASQELSKLLQRAPDDIQALSKQAKLLISQERWSDAVTTLEHLASITDDPIQHQEANLELAAILIENLAQSERAKRLLRKHVKIYANDTRALRLLYVIASQDNNWNDAKLTLEELQEIDSQDAIWAKIQFTQVARNANWPDAQRSFYEEAAVKAILNHRDFFDYLCQDYISHREMDRLILACKRLLESEIDPKLISEYKGCVAAFMVADKQYKEALSFLSSIIKDDNNTDWAYLARAQALFSAGQYDSSAAEFRRTLSRNLTLLEAFPPFLEVLKQLDQRIALTAASALYQHLTKPEIKLKHERCINGAPRGFFDFQLLSLNPRFFEAERYLRLMSPHVFQLYAEEDRLNTLDHKHRAVLRCKVLFGQMLDIKRFFIAAHDPHKDPCRVLLAAPLSLVFDEKILAADEAYFDLWASHAMHQALSGACLLNAISDEEAMSLFNALCQVRPDHPYTSSLKKSLWRVLPRNDRKPFKDGVPFIAPQISQLREALNDRAICIGSIFSASPKAALAAFPNNIALQHFLVSDQYENLVRLYWAELR